jgi:hypothetical protein
MASSQMCHGIDQLVVASAVWFTSRYRDEQQEALLDL